MQLTASDVGTTQLTISWRPSRPQRRHMPVLRYEIYMTHDKQCALGHDDEICDWREHGERHAPRGVISLRSLSLIS